MHSNDPVVSLRVRAGFPPLPPKVDVHAWRWAGAYLALLAACGRQDAAFPATTGAPPTAQETFQEKTLSKSVPPALREASEAKGRCDGLEGQTLGDPEQLLQGRLILRMLAGRRGSGPQYAFAPVDTSFGQSDVASVRQGDRSIVVVADELFARLAAPDREGRTAELFEAVSKLWPPDASVRALHTEALAAVEVEPGAPEVQGEGLLVLAAYVADPDAMVIRLRFYVDQEAQGAGCAGVARRMARTLAEGRRRLRESGGPLPFGFYDVEVPRGYVFLEDRLPNGFVYRLERVGSLLGPRARVVIYYGQHGIGIPFPPQPPGANRVMRPFLGNDHAWASWSADEGGVRTSYQRADAGNVGPSRSMAVVGFATTDPDLVNELDAIATSVRYRQ